MGAIMDTIFGKDIILDEAAFTQAADDFRTLSGQLQELRGKIEDMMETLKAGFDTPAGVKFINSCEANLFTPLDAQKLVIDHISETLLLSKQSYDSVFQQYESLQSAINQVNN